MHPSDEMSTPSAGPYPWHTKGLYNPHQSRNHSREGPPEAPSSNLVHRGLNKYICSGKNKIT